MKYLKNFESFNYSNEDELIEKIRDTVDSLAYDFESFDDFDPNDHPEIKTDLAVISYKKEIEDIYDSIEPTDMSLEEFTILYNKLVEESEKKVADYLLNTPFPEIDVLTDWIDIPDWVVDANKTLTKFNL